EGGPHDRCFVPAVHQAVCTPWVFACAVPVPGGLLHHFAERGIVGVGNQIAGRFPTEGIACRVAPGSAAHVPAALKQVHIERCSHEWELLEERGHLIEFIMYLISVEKDIVFYALIAEGRGDQQAVNFDIGEHLEQALKFFYVGVFVNRSVCAYSEPPLLCLFYRLNGLSESPAFVCNSIMGLFQSVQMKVDGESGVWLELLNKGFSKEAISAQIHLFFHLKNLSHKRNKFLVKKRFSSRYSDNRGI